MEEYQKRYIPLHKLETFEFQDGRNRICYIVDLILRGGLGKRMKGKLIEEIINITVAFKFIECPGVYKVLMEKMKEFSYEKEGRHVSLLMKKYLIEGVEPLNLQEVLEDFEDDPKDLDYNFYIVEEPENEKEECQICFEKKSNYVSKNCGHLVCCGKCVEKLNICPYCRIQGDMVYYKRFKGKIFK